MPRETIYADGPQDGGATGDDSFALTIGWEKDHGLAQVGIILPAGETLLTRLYSDDRVKARIGEQFVAHMRERPDEFLLGPYESNDQMLAEYARLGGLFLYWAQEARGWVGEHDGLWFTVNSRRILNVLIRLARKARDESFGRDE